MSNDPASAKNSADTVAEITQAALNLRGRISEDGLRSVIKTALLMLIPLVVSEYQALTPEEQSLLLSKASSRLSILLTIPGVQAAYEVWRKDR